MVYTHGSAYVFGSSGSSFYGPDYIVSQGVILVTMNYRLNVFGNDELEATVCILSPERYIDDLNFIQVFSTSRKTSVVEIRGCGI